MEDIMGILAGILTAFRQLRSFRVGGSLQFDSAPVHRYYRGLIDSIICELQAKNRDVAAYVHAMHKVKIWQYRSVIVIDISATADPDIQYLLRKTFNKIMKDNNTIFAYTIPSGEMSRFIIDHYMDLLGIEDLADRWRNRRSRRHAPQQRLASAG